MRFPAINLHLYRISLCFPYVFPCFPHVYEGMFHLFLCFSHGFPIKTSIDSGFSHVFPGFSHGVWGFVDGMAPEVAIVTGASRGIGAAIADALAKVVTLW